jgi:hypothetical protein
VEWLEGHANASGQVVTDVGGPMGACMSPIYAACTSKLVKPTVDLVFVEFVMNDLFRKGGVVLCRSCSLLLCPTADRALFLVIGQE